jgi:hypothetical protein
LTKTLKKVDGFTGKSLLGGLPNEFKSDAIQGFVDDVESGEIEPMMMNGNIVFTKDGKYIRDDQGDTLEIPFDDLDTPDIKIKPRGQMKRRLILLGCGRSLVSVECPHSLSLVCYQVF